MTNEPRTQKSKRPLSGQLMDEHVELTFAELCRYCGLPAERVIELIDYGLIEPHGQQPSSWRFTSVSVRRIHCALRLQDDLGVNTAGAALAVDLLEELEALRARLQRFES